MAALLVAVPAATAAAASPEKGPIVRVELDFAASNGLQAHLETSEKKVATLALTGQEHRVIRRVTYSTRAEVTEAGLEVRFGKLGLIDATFTPTTTLNSTEPPEGCTGRREPCAKESSPGRSNSPASVNTYGSKGRRQKAR